MAFMIESLKKNRQGILLMSLSALLASFGQMFWKLFRNEGAWAYLILGFVLYGCGALVMIVAYRFGKLSVLQPMLCLSYVFAIFISIFILNEQITTSKLAGILVVIFGVVMIAGGDSPENPPDNNMDGSP